MSDNLHNGAHPLLFNYARKNRRTMTPAERYLWQALRNRNVMGRKFRRQHPIANFIADFYCMEKRLIIEVDGVHHFDAEQKQYDDWRTSELANLNIKVIRFTNDQIIERIDWVIQQIKSHL